MLWCQEDREPAEEEDRVLPDAGGEWAEAGASVPEETVFAPIAAKRSPTNEGRRALRSSVQSAALP
jgi:hypothetical protein